jgi:hypothetical protein
MEHLGRARCGWPQVLRLPPRDLVADQLEDGDRGWACSPWVESSSASNARTAAWSDPGSNVDDIGRIITAGAASAGQAAQSPERCHHLATSADRVSWGRESLVNPWICGERFQEAGTSL